VRSASRRRLTATATAAAAVLAGLSLAVPASASQAAPGATAAATTASATPPAGQPQFLRQVRRAALPAGEHYVCPAPAVPGQVECMSIVRPAPGGGFQPAVPAASGNYGPAQLRSAYKLTSASLADGRGATIAVVDAYKDPRAAADLARYRAKFGLGACTTATGCLRIVNQNGSASPLPRANWNWAGEESLDLDMVSAICPNCRIILVEARTPTLRNLGMGDDTAVRLGAKFISNSWAAGEYVGQDSYDRYFNHPGAVLDFAAGDSGYGPAYPTDLQYVTAVGGTALRRAGNARGWTESVWGSAIFGSSGTGSGCSAIEAKPSWQRADATPTGCLNRTENDVAADADPSTGVAVYDSYPSPEWPKGWSEFGGTSAATPIITAVYALAGTPVPRSYPSEDPYLRPGRLFKVTSGSNGTCETYRRYLCHGTTGFNGPTGLGTPDGVAAFRGGSANRVSVLDPGTADRSAGTTFSERITGLDARPGGRLHWSVTGLPAGARIRAIPHSTDARITAALPSAPASYQVTVTASDGAAHASTHFAVIGVGSLAVASPPAGHLSLAYSKNCATAGTDAAGQPVSIVSCSGLTGQDWSYVSSGVGETGTLTVGGQCLAVPGRGGVLQACDGSARQRWRFAGSGQLRNAATGRCLAVAGLRDGARLVQQSCGLAGHVGERSWRLPVGLLESGTGGLCLDYSPGSTILGTQAEMSLCDGSRRQQQWTLAANGNIRSRGGYCLDGSGGTVGGESEVLDQTPVVLNLCSGDSDLDQIWQLGPGGELINAWSGRCLSGGGAGSGLVIDDCYGLPGEVWAQN
jgi:hypothetical protein